MPNLNERLVGFGRTLLLRGPWAGPLRSGLRLIRRWRFSSSDYWERRYAEGGHSGVGSFGALAEFKAEVLNGFVERHSIRGVIELGCGDGNQLALYRFPTYIGTDVSRTAIEQCQARFAGDPTRRFLLYTSDLRERLPFPAADLSLSIDVIYHLVEDQVLHAYLDNLFAAAERYVIVYSTDFDRRYDTPHQLDRAITGIIRERFPEFELVETIVNPHKGPDSMSDFFVYRRMPPGRARGG